MQIGTGWLGWTERETLDTLITTIESAYEGLLEKLRLIQAGAFTATVSPSPPVPVPASEVFKAFRFAGGSAS